MTAQEILTSVSDKSVYSTGDEYRQAIAEALTQIETELLKMLPEYEPISDDDQYRAAKAEGFNQAIDQATRAIKQFCRRQP